MNNMMRMTPFRDFERLMDRWRWPLDEGALETRGWMPSVDIDESADSFLVKVEVPEVKPEDLQVEVDHGVLTVRGERRTDSEDRKHHRSERFYGSFERSFRLPENVREDAIRAEHRDGMLYIQMDKHDIHRKPRKLEIKAG